ncbi:MAG: hypothetical protein ACLPYW_14585 [Acidimicrobiales bacterium]
MSSHPSGVPRSPRTTDPAVRPFVSSLHKIVQVASTVPANGDVNPYGIVVLPATTGALVKGDYLVSNFNDKANVQGTGTTVVEVSPGGRRTLFAKIGSLAAGLRCPGGIGLSTALTVLPGGWVVVGSAPAAGPSGTPAVTNPEGCLLVLNSAGKVVETWSSPALDAPWDLTAAVSGGRTALFVSNVLSRPASVVGVPQAGLCMVDRIDVSLGSGPPRMTGMTVIGNHFPWEVEKSAFALGPTGLALGRNGTLYVSQTLVNHITAIPDAVTRTTAVADGTSTLTAGNFLDGPLGMVLAPNGDLIVTNGGNGNAVEISPAGRQIAKVTLAKDGAGDLFGLALTANGRGIVFVNDGSNALDTATLG